MKNPDLESLFKKYQAGECTPDEEQLIEYVIFNRKNKPFLSVAEIESDQNEIRLAITPQHFFERSSRYFSLKAIAAAAAIVILIGAWILLFVQNPSIPQYHNDINPGTNRARITFSNGKTINLSDAKTGILIDGDKIFYNDGESVEQNNNNPLSAQGGFNSEGERKVTVITPKGGEYQITLPDGSKVWLNAASSLTYCTSLNELGEDRRVTLSGEAYFEIFKDKKRPFIVKTRLQEVEVLGTHFNISAYTDENGVKTTLVEGSVKVNPLSLKGDLPEGERKGKKPESGGVTLKPNQQSVITVNSPIKVEDVDVNTAMAWKNGEFAFRNEPLESIMHKVARWYNVEVVYENKELATIPFGGSISRFGKVSEVLYMLQLTGKVKFKIEGRKVIVN